MPIKNRAIAKPKKQERRVAEELGGRRVPFSGSQRHDPGDVSTDEYLVDTKRTEASFTLSAGVVNKLVSEASRKGKIPVLQLDLDNPIVPRGRKKWALIPWPLFLRLTGREE